MIRYELRRCLRLLQVQDLMRMDGSILQNIQQTTRTIMTIPYDRLMAGKSLTVRLASADAACNEEARKMLRAALKCKSGESAAQPEVP